MVKHIGEDGSSKESNLEDQACTTQLMKPTSMTASCPDLLDRIVGGK